MKTCNSCNKLKDLSAFNKCKGGSLGLQGKCRECQSAFHKNYVKNNKELIKDYRKSYYEKNKKKAKSARLKRMYGITIEDYFKMFEAQGKKCKICHSSEPGKGQVHFAVDHCHTTGLVRGVICNDCNSGLGYFKDNPEFLLSAIEYLK